MKICLISKQFYPATIGGAETYMYEIYKRIKKENDVTIFTYDDVDCEGAEVIPVPKVHFTISSFLFSIIAGLKARSRDYDIVHINGYWGEFSGVFVENGIVTVHDVGFIGKAGILNKIRFFLIDNMIKSAKKVFTDSERVKNEILQHFKISEDKIVVIPIGINIEMYGSTGSARNFRKNYLTNDDTMVLSFGRFARNKGYEFLIDAFKDIEEKVNNCYLIIAGRAEDEKYLRELRERAGDTDKIQFLTDVSEGEKIGLFAACDIYCQPSIAEEGFGISILEAMASGKPCIATDAFSGVGHLPNDFLVRSGDKKALAKKIVELLSSDYISVGASMRKIAEKYSWNEISLEIIRLYEEVNMPK